MNIRKHWTVISVLLVVIVTIVLNSINYPEVEKPQSVITTQDTVLERDYGTHNIAVGYKALNYSANSQIDTVINNDIREMYLNGTWQITFIKISGILQGTVYLGNGERFELADTKEQHFMAKEAGFSSYMQTGICVTKIRLTKIN